MSNYGINIRCTEGEAESLAAEVRQEGLSATVNYDIGQRYPGEKPYPAHWLMATVIVRGFKDEIAIWHFTDKFGLHRRGRVPFLYQSKERI